MNPSATMTVVRDSARPVVRNAAHTASGAARPPRRDAWYLLMKWHEFRIAPKFVAIVEVPRPVVAELVSGNTGGQSRRLTQ